MAGRELKRIVFYAGRCIPIHARSLEERPLGGTETGLIRVSAELKRRGYEVIVFTSMREPPQGGPDAPMYAPITVMPQLQSCDALITVQDWWGSFIPIQAKRRYYWTGDAADQYMSYGIGDRRVASKIDGMLLVSEWQANQLSAESGFPREKCTVVYNGVHLPSFEGEETRSPNRLIFASSPYRGLELVPPLYAELKRRIPELELHVFSGLSIYDREQPYHGPEQEQYERIKQTLETLPGCVIHGNIRQELLARELMKSSLLFYPNIFPETSCMVALESMAAGCPVLTSDFAALPETVGDGGVVVPGPPGSPGYLNMFVEAAERILKTPELWRQLSARGMKRVRANHSWEQVADRLEAAISI